MKSRLAIIALLVCGAASTVEAQCSAAALQARQGCFAAVDLVNFMSPQLATTIAGGSSTLGQSGALGGLGRFALSLRGTAIMSGTFPEIDASAFRTDGQPASYTTKSQLVPGGGVDAAIGIWKGVNMGASRIGGIDLLVSALYMPDIEGEGGDFSIKAKDGNTKLGYGVRIGVLEESVVTPGLYVSYLQRDLPTVSLTGTTSNGTFALNDFSVKTSAIRVVAAKNFLIFGLQAGIGQDSYESTANINATVTSILGSSSASAAANMSMTRTNMFVGGMMNFFVAKLVVEAGTVTGGSLPDSFNTFDGAKDLAKASRTYISGGIRIAF